MSRGVAALHGVIAASSPPNLLWTLLRRLPDVAELTSTGDNRKPAG